ncbi:MAG: 2'-5' RNA ligase family protein [Lewinellaceae bacterium]|nr:2'-5' RNA ligase family protein [Saprospiraceae bacterium]MCB9331963.1 2'-5' RNA ligase family protein [Lewinellaceae bacterium]
MKSEPHPLFFIALLPDTGLQSEVTAFKQYCARHFGASHALKSPPHITMVSPFRWQIDRLPVLAEALAEFSGQQTAFEIELRDFGCFAPRVLFVDMVKNPNLEVLESKLALALEEKTGLKRKSGHGFHPHMTIAHRDLQERYFREAWAYFSKLEFRRSFQAKALTLLRHTGGKWGIETTFPFPEN